jgi:hypothetical protein
VAAQQSQAVLHGGGQSRRLPAYAPVGKILMPLPVFRWARGQRLDQSLLDLQLPEYERVLAHAPEGTVAMVTSGDEQHNLQCASFQRQVADEEHGHDGGLEAANPAACLVNADRAVRKMNQATPNGSTNDNRPLTTDNGPMPIIHRPNPESADLIAMVLLQCYTAS